MKKISIIKICIIILILTTLKAEVILPSKSLENWEILKNNKIWIGWKHSSNFDWCRAISIIEAPIQDVRKIIEDKGNYPQRGLGQFQALLVDFLLASGLGLAGLRAQGSLLWSYKIKKPATDEVGGCRTD